MFYFFYFGNTGFRRLKITLSCSHIHKRYLCARSIRTSWESTSVIIKTLASFRCHDENGNGDAKMLFWYLCACARLRGNPKLTFCFRDRRQIGHFSVVPQRWNILVKHGWWKWSKHEQTTLKGKFLSFKVRNESLLSYQTISNVTHSFISKEFFCCLIVFQLFFEA